MPHSITTVGLILVCLQVSYLLMAQEQFDEFQVLGSDPCGQSYQYRQDGRWIEALCVGGFINGTLHKCQPSSEDCPVNQIAARRSRQKRHAEIAAEEQSPLHSRQKRQANPGEVPGSCDRTFSCPPNLSTVYIYPDWSNPNCDTYVQCENGVSALISCLEFGLRYFNPRLLSCENTTTSTNTCVWRLATNLSPIL